MNLRADHTFDGNLLSLPATAKWWPRFSRRKDSWKVISGKWQILAPRKVVYYSHPSPKASENIAIIGSRSWEAYTLEIHFKILTPSYKPPEGGAIIYFLYRNIKNYYSLHICISKQKMEVIKRYQGAWTTIAEKNHVLEIQKKYLLKITTHSGLHQIQLNGGQSTSVSDHNILQGCVGIGVKYCDIELSHAQILFHSNSPFL